ncbi:MAG: RnfH family protein [Azoarcus sp.]|jgi:putative ubiquitin-RnfH superfamily antitoxin RatB of RatAB toxin-antitoxin module|nr:RnfH family protein [Azoarcus sp.]
MGSEYIEIEVVYAQAHYQDVVMVKVPEGATVLEAVEASGLLLKYPEIEPGGRNKLGIYAKSTQPGTVLHEHDRVEIYRPLIADPKVVRKQRAEEGKVMKRGGGAVKSDNQQ